jgi:hypothetical protein
MEAHDKEAVSVDTSVTTIPSGYTAWNLASSLSLVTALVTIVVALTTWGVISSIANQGFNDVVRIHESQTLLQFGLGGTELTTEVARLANILRNKLATLANLMQFNEDTVREAMFAIMPNCDVDAIFVGFPNGRLVGYERDVTTSVVTSVLTNVTHVLKFTLDAAGRSVNVTSVFPFVNITTRPWYIDGLTFPAGTFSLIYVSGVFGYNTATYSLPVYNSFGDLQGVVGVDVSSSRQSCHAISRVIQQLNRKLHCAFQLQSNTNFTGSHVHCSQHLRDVGAIQQTHRQSSWNSSWTSVNLRSGNESLGLL